MNFKQASDLIDFFEECYVERYGIKPQINRIRDKWNMRDLYNELGMREVKKLIRLYFSSISSNQHSLQFFYNNYEKLIVQQQLREKDLKHRKEVLKQTKKRVKNEQRSSTNQRGLQE